MIEHDKNYSGRKIRVQQEIVIAGDSLCHHARNRYPAGTILTIVSWRPEGFMLRDGILFKKYLNRVELLNYYQQCNQCGIIYCSTNPVIPHAYCIRENCNGIVPYDAAKQEILHKKFKEQSDNGTII